LRSEDASAKYPVTNFKNYLSLVKFSHTVFALPFAVIGFFLGLKQTGFQFDLLLFLKVILCMVFARTSAMAFNRYADRMIDEKNDRTRVREIPSGIISARSAFALVILSSLLFILVTYFINTICFYLSPVALLVVLGYSYTKRFTSLCHLVLGLGLSLAPIGAYLAVTGTFDWLPLLFSFTVLCWVSGFDIIYALQDEAFDKANQLYSLPASLGKLKALKVSSALHLFSAVFVILAGFSGHFGIIYWIGVSAFVFLLIYQHTLVKPNDLSKVNIAFFSTNGIASIVFASFVVAEIIFK
jgi:4-hydroxybenzoate polyprenyltransferase